VIAPWSTCDRLLVGQGGATWDPVCVRPWGHAGLCSSQRPHLYRFDGRWWISWNGRESFRKGITLNDRPVVVEPVYDFRSPLLSGRRA
jgi:hypothetical protein